MTDANNTMIEQAPIQATPAYLPPAPAPAQGSGSKLNTILGSIAIVLATLIVANGVTKYFPGFGANSPVAVLDADLISAAGIHDLLQRAATMSPGAVEIESKKRAEALQAKLDDFKKRGFVVLDRTMALAWPDAADITEQVATAVEIPPSAIEAVRAKRVEQQRLTTRTQATPSTAGTGVINGSALD